MRPRLTRSGPAPRQALGAMRTVRSFAAEALELQRYQASVGAPPKGGWWPERGETTYRTGVLKAIVGAGLGGSGFLVVFGALHASLWVGFVMITDEQLKFGKLSAFQAYQIQIVIGIGQIAASAVQLAQAKGGAAKIFKLLDRPAAIPVAGGQVPPAVAPALAPRPRAITHHPTSTPPSHHLLLLPPRPTAGARGADARRRRLA